MSQEPEHHRTPSDPAVVSHRLAYELAGALPCVSCGYDLAGLSILDRCPECGIEVRETLVDLIDPFAEEASAVRCPRILAATVLIWSGSVLVAALLIWALRIVDAVCTINGINCRGLPMGAFAAGFIGLASLAGLGLSRPTDSVSVRAVFATILASLALAGAGALTAFMLVVHDPYRGAPYFGDARMDTGRILQRLAIGALLVTATLLYRVNAREISSRSKAMRANHANKQRLLTVAASLGAALVGDAVLLAGDSIGGGAVELCSVVGGVLIAVGSGILAIALVGVLLDSVSIARTLWNSPVAFRDVVRRTPRAG